MPEPTPWLDDRLNRKAIADKFEKIQENADSGCVFLVHAEFGMGKTYFVRNWHSSLIDRSHPVIHFDAWLYDYFENPLAAFISAINDQAGVGSKADQVKFSLRQFSKKAAPLLLKVGGRIGLKIISMGAVDGDIDTVSEIVKDEFVDASDRYLSEVAESFEKSLSQRDFRQTLRESFEQTVSAITEESEGRNLIVIIDELDRCKPKFALDFLEDIKHFLSVSGVQYFIFCDENVLHGQAEMMLGAKKSGEKYVQKFQDYRFKLPTANNGEAIAGYFLSSFNGDENFISTYEAKAAYFANLTEHYNFSLRQSLQLIDFGKIVSLESGGLMSGSWALMWYLIVLREADREKYSSFTAGVEHMSIPPIVMNSIFPERDRDFIMSVLSESPSMKISKFIDKIDVAGDSYKLRQLLRLVDDVQMRDGGTFSDLRIKLGYRIETLGAIIN